MYLCLGKRCSSEASKSLRAKLKLLKVHVALTLHGNFGADFCRDISSGEKKDVMAILLLNTDIKRVWIRNTPVSFLKNLRKLGRCKRPIWIRYHKINTGHTPKLRSSWKSSFSTAYHHLDKTTKAARYCYCISKWIT